MSLSKVWFTSVKGLCSFLITPIREMHVSFLNANSMLTLPVDSSEIASSLNIKKAECHGRKYNLELTFLLTLEKPLS